MSTREAVARAICKANATEWNPLLPDEELIDGSLLWTDFAEQADAAIAAHLEALKAEGLLRTEYSVEKCGKCGAEWGEPGLWDKRVCYYNGKTPSPIASAPKG